MKAFYIDQFFAFSATVIQKHFHLTNYFLIITTLPGPAPHLSLATSGDHLMMGGETEARPGGHLN